MNGQVEPFLTYAILNAVAAFGPNLSLESSCIMNAFEIADIITQHHERGRPYHEFFRTETLSLGLYVIPTGEKDSQSPHTEEEVYYVLEGDGMIRVDDEDRPVSAGSTIFVGIGVEHRFHSIIQDLKLLVFWAPPWRSGAAVC